MASATAPTTTTPALTKDALRSHAFHAVTAGEACSFLHSHHARGLAVADAVQRKAVFGANVMTPGKQHGLLKKVWDQVANILVVILLAAAIVAGILKDWVELGFILGVVVVNIVIGVVQESKAEKAAEALKKLLSPSAVVIRDGVRTTVDAADLVPGDLVFMDAGARVPADARLIDSSSLAVMEAALTGESVPASKEASLTLPADAVLADRHNMVYAGTMLTLGQCIAIVTATGDHNEIGRINRMVATVEAGKTPLIVQIEQFGRWLSVSVIAIGIITLLLALLARHNSIGESFKIAVAVAVAIIPEGLPSVVTIILAFGVQAMSRKHAIIRQMPAVETLGSVSIICSDKTGTLTRNEMTAVQLRACMGDTGAFRFTGQGFSPDGELKRGDSAVAPQERARLMFALLPAVLCNDSALQASGNGAGDASSATVNVPIVETADHALAVSSMLVEPAGAADVPDAHMPVKSAAPAEGAAGMTPAAAASDSLAELGQDIDSRRRASAVIGTARSGSDSGIPHSRSRDIGDSSGPSGRRLPTMSAAELELARFAEAGGGNFKATAFAEGLEWQLTGDPTEGALLVAAMKAGWHNPAGAQARCPRLSTVPFDSDHKFMATLHDVPVPRALLLDAAAAAPAADPAVPSVAGSAAGGELVTNMRRLLLVKGAPDRIIARAAQQPRPGGNPFDTEPIDAEAWQACADSLSAEGLRVLALAMVEVPTTVTSVTAADITGGAPRLTLTALVGIVDPPRSECIAAIRECHSAGVRVAMITGDSPLTAKAIGAWLGIPTSEVLTGQAMQAMSDEQLADHVGACNIYARATPEHKLRIVRALQGRYKLVCAMTGDGVNDAAALKASNVGIAMGITGTEVAKEASRMVLADDRFDTIVAAIKEGRRVYDNLRKVLMYILPTNIAQGLCIVAAIILGMPFPLNAIQVLYVNMITSVTLGVVLALEPAEPGVMQRPPRKAGKPIVGRLIIWRSLYVGLLLIVAILGNMQWELVRSGSTNLPEDANTPALAQARAVAMATLTTGQAIYIFNCRYLKATSLRTDIMWANPLVLLMALLNVGLQCLLVYTPGLNDVFGLAPIDGIAWLRCIMLSVAVFVVVEFEKFVGPRCIRPLFKPCLRVTERSIAGRGARAEAQAAASAGTDATAVARSPAAYVAASTARAGAVEPTAVLINAQ